MKGDKATELKTNAEIAVGVRYCIVRVGKGVLKFREKISGPVSSGIVIRYKPDNVLLGNGADIWVLTSDHGTRPLEGRQLFGVYVGFGDQTTGFPKYKATEVIRGDEIKDPVEGKPIDLAILKVRIDDVGDLPGKLTPPAIAEVAADKPLFLAGYGRTAGKFADDRDGTGYRFDKTIPIGTYRAGTDTLKEREADHVTTGRGGEEWAMVYRYDSLVGELVYKDTLGADNNLLYEAGDAYVLAGDSGGPTLQKIDNVWKLVGIHSESENPNANGILLSRSNWWDVDLSKYKTEIERKAGIGGLRP